LNLSAVVSGVRAWVESYLNHIKFCTFDQVISKKSFWAFYRSRKRWGRELTPCPSLPAFGGFGQERWKNL